MTRYSFEVSFDAMRGRLAEMLAEDPGRAGVISITIRGHAHPVTIARLKAGEDVQKEYELTDAGLMILRPRYAELVAYWDIYTMHLNTYQVEKLAD